MIYNTSLYGIQDFIIIRGASNLMATQAKDSSPSMLGRLLSPFKKILSSLNQLRKSTNFIYFVAGLTIGVLFNLFLDQIGADRVLEFLDNLVPEGVGIMFTILILDRLNENREQRNIIRQLVRRVHSRDNRTALSAVEELRVLGHLEDGTLAGLELRGSNWQDANMYQANLKGTDLIRANLFKADFVLANLEDAQVVDEQLASTDTMHGAIMPDGRKYDGRYNLPGDFTYANREKIDVDSPEAMAEWFGVPLKQYLEGQAWATDNLHRFARRSTDYDETDESNMRA